MGEHLEKAVEMAAESYNFPKDATERSTKLLQRGNIFTGLQQLAETNYEKLASTALPGEKDPAKIDALATAKTNMERAQKNTQDFLDKEVKPAVDRDSSGRTVPKFYFVKLLHAGAMDSKGNVSVPSGFTDVLNHLYASNGVRYKDGSNKPVSWEDYAAKLKIEHPEVLKNVYSAPIIKEAFQAYQNPYSTNSKLNFDTVDSAPPPPPPPPAATAGKTVGSKPSAAQPRTVQLNQKLRPVPAGVDVDADAVVEAQRKKSYEKELERKKALQAEEGVLPSINLFPSSY